MIAKIQFYDQKINNQVIKKPQKIDRIKVSLVIKIK